MQQLSEIIMIATLKYKIGHVSIEKAYFVSIKYLKSKLFSRGIIVCLYMAIVKTT